MELEEILCDGAEPGPAARGVCGAVCDRDGTKWKSTIANNHAHARGGLAFRGGGRASLAQAARWPPPVRLGSLAWHQGSRRCRGEVCRLTLAL